MIARVPTVLPFRAVRPTASGAALAPKLSPPYDVISPAERARLARDPHKPVHVILPAGQDPDVRYHSAAEILSGWLAEGALARDPAPAFYVYEQRFEVAG